MTHRVLVACEFTGLVREAFARRGFDAWSCDLTDTEIPGQHHIGDVRTILYGNGWDLMVAHPPCTYLAYSGARWWPGREREQALALHFVRELLEAPIPRIAVENPPSLIAKAIRRYDHVTQPWMFGHPETKAACWWLKNLPPLRATDRVSGRTPRVAGMSQRRERGRDRSRTLPGVAEAIATQWGAVLRGQSAGS